jgi:hypothetical protein
MLLRHRAERQSTVNGAAKQKLLEGRCKGHEVRTGKNAFAKNVYTNATEYSVRDKPTSPIKSVRITLEIVSLTVEWMSPTTHPTNL